MSFLDNLENNLKSLESSEQGKDDAERAHRTRENERAQAQAVAPFAEQLKQSPYTAELLKQAARVGFSLRTKVHIAWLGSTLRLEARDKRLELRPTPAGHCRRLYRERAGNAHRSLRPHWQCRRPGPPVARLSANPSRAGSYLIPMQKPAFDPGLTQQYTGNLRRVDQQGRHLQCAPPGRHLAGLSSLSAPDRHGVGPVLRRVVSGLPGGEYALRAGLLLAGSGPLTGRRCIHGMRGDSSTTSSSARTR